MATQQGGPTDGDGRIDISGFKLVALTAMMLLSFSAAIGMAFNITAIVGSFTVSNTAAGLVATIEMTGVAAGSLLFSQIAPRFDPHRIYIAAIGSIIGLTLLTIWAPSIEFLYVLRGVNGFCAGAVIATVMSTAGRSTAPEATFGVINSAVGVMGMVLSIVLPQALKLGALDGLSSVDGLYVVYMLLAVAAIGFIRYVPVAPQMAGQAQSNTPAPPLPLMGWAALVGLGMIFFGHGTLVMFIVSVGTEQVGLSPEIVGLVFMFGSVFGIVAPLAAGYIGTHYKAVLPTAAIIVAMILLGILLSQATSPIAFYIAGPFFAMMPIAMMPIALGAIARIDTSGRLAGAHPAFVTLGAALAPLVGGAISSTGDYAANGWAVAVCGVIGGALLFTAIRAADNLRDGQGVATVPAAGG